MVSDGYLLILYWFITVFNTIYDRNSIDQELELNMDVLDDLGGEGIEIYENGNNWLTYGEPLHRLREFGSPIREMDLIDETKLSSEQMRIVCAAM